MSTYFKLRFDNPANRGRRRLTLFAGPDAEHLANCGKIILLDHEADDLVSCVTACQGIKNPAAIARVITEAWFAWHTGGCAQLGVALAALDKEPST